MLSRLTLIFGAPVGQRVVISVHKCAGVRFLEI